MYISTVYLFCCDIFLTEETSDKSFAGNDCTVQEEAEEQVQECDTDIEIKVKEEEEETVNGKKMTLQ